jgi:hypothetical protein
MRALLLSLSLAIAATCAQASEPVTVFNVVLLQSSSILEGRVESVDAMAEYIKAVETALGEAVVASGAKQSTSGFIVVAVRPGQESNVWFDFDTLLDLEMRRQIASKVKAVKPFEARNGPVVFALKVGTWNAKESKRSVPLPPEWKNATQGGPPLEIGELVQRVWTE